MNIDGTNGLACLTKVDRDEKNATRVAPLPHLVSHLVFGFFKILQQCSLLFLFLTSLFLFCPPLLQNALSSSSRTLWST